MVPHPFRHERGGDGFGKRIENDEWRIASACVRHARFVSSVKHFLVPRAAGGMKSRLVGSPRGAASEVTPAIGGKKHGQG